MSEKIKTEIDVDELYKPTYKKIVTWHNENPTRETLEQLSMELIEDIITSVAKGFGGDVKISEKSGN